MRWLVVVLTLLLAGGALLWPRLERARSEATLEEVVAQVRRRLGPVADLPPSAAGRDVEDVRTLERARELCAQASAALQDGAPERATRTLVEALDLAWREHSTDLVGLMTRTAGEGEVLDVLEAGLDERCLDPAAARAQLEERLRRARDARAGPRALSAELRQAVRTLPDDLGAVETIEQLGEVESVLSGLLYALDRRSGLEPPIPGERARGEGERFLSLLDGWDAHRGRLEALITRLGGAPGGD